MIDIRNEQLRLLAKASCEVPGRPHVSTLMRWAMRGVKGVKLETVVIGGRRFTSIEAIQRFVARLSAPQAVQATSRDHEDARIARELDKAGIR